MENKFMTSFRNLACALCLVPLAGAASAQSGAAVDRADLDTTTRIGTEIGTYVGDYLSGYGDLFEPQILLRMGVVAQQRAVAHTCDGFEVDEERYSAAMNGVMEPLLTMFEAPADGGAAINLPFTIAMSAYSMLLGGYIAAGAAEPDELCAMGDQLRESFSGGEGEDLLIWTTVD